MKSKASDQFFSHTKPAKIPRTTEKKFKVNDYYQSVSELFVYKAMIAIPTYKGSQLITKYYSEKYKSNVILPSKEDVNFYFEPDCYLAEARKKESNRLAILLKMDGIHATPVIYFKENGQEIILIADSLGICKNSFQEKIAIAQFLSKKLKMLVYYIKEPRQADLHSCYSDAILFAVKSTAINSNTETYIIPNMLNFLKEHAVLIKEDVENVFSTRLPDELLITCQISSFLKIHQERQSPKFIHKEETLTLFRERYTEKNVPVLIDDFKNPMLMDVYAYPRIKSFKFIQLIVIQYYLNLINSEGKQLSSDERTSFIKEVKIILNSTDEFEDKINSVEKLADNFRSLHANVCA